jgi:transcriptional regulator with XRE-family HTH domain
MDLFDKDKADKKEDAYIHEQLSLDFDTAVEINAPQVQIPEDDAHAENITAQAPTPGNETHVESRAERKRREKQEKKNRKKKKHPLVDGHLGIGVGSLGKFLQDMRVKSDYSISQVEQLTRIKKKYIELLEMEKLRFELPSVYVLAYVRKLCTCYKVPESEIVGIINELKDTLESSLPADFIENINLDYEIDEENQKKVRHLAWFLLGGIIVFIVLVGIAVFILSSPAKSKTPKYSSSTSTVEKFDQEKLKVLQAPVILEATELPAKNNN